MTTISLPLYAAVALAGAGFVLVGLRLIGWSVEVPDRGTSAGQRPPEPSAHARKAPAVPISMFAGRQTHLIVLVIIAADFGC